jgi:GntR family transcriptional regulator
MKLERDSPIPLYHQVMEILETKITTGEWKDGDRLPTESELAEQFDISNITVKRAVHELVDKGLLYRQRGKGTFVAPQIKEGDIFKLLTFGAEEEYPHKTIEFSIQEAGKKVSTLLNTKETDLIVKVLRLKLDNDKPIGIEHTYLNHQLCPFITQTTIENQLFYNALQKQNIKLGKARIYFSAIFASEEEGNLLLVKKGTPLISIKRITYTQSEEIIEYSTFIVRQDHAHYFIEVSL